MNRLLSLREERGITQECVAQLLNVSRQAYSRYEREERELGYPALLTLSRFFDVSVDYLLGFSDLYYPDKIVELDTYTAEERKVIEDYRKLTRGMREILRTTLSAMVNDTSDDALGKKIK